MAPSLNDAPDSSMVAAYAGWIRGLPDEIGYWRGYLQSRGGDYADDFACRLRGDTWVRDWNRHAELSLRGIGVAALEVVTGGIPLDSGRRWILAQIRKRPGVETRYALSPANLPIKYRLLLAERLQRGFDRAPEPDPTAAVKTPLAGGPAGTTGRVAAAEARGVIRLLGDRDSQAR